MLTVGAILVNIICPQLPTYKFNVPLLRLIFAIGDVFLCLKLCLRFQTSKQISIWERARRQPSTAFLFRLTKAAFWELSENPAAAKA
jgi:hypothetical protein